MDIKTNALYLSAYQLFVNVIACLLNGFVLFHFLKKRKEKAHHQFTMLLIKAIFESICSICSAVYCASVLLKLSDVLRDATFLYHSGCLLTSLFTPMGVLTLLVAVDRLLAVRKPVQYSIGYALKLQKAALCGVVLLSAIFFFWFAFTKRPDVPDGYLNSEMWEVRVANISENITIGGFIASYVVTIVFLIEFRHFSRTRNFTFMARNAKNIKLANKIVVFQMIAEFILLICPKIAESAVQHSTGNPISSYIGPFHSPLFSTYIALCAFFFCIMTAKKNKMSPTTTGNNISSS